ncbi:hypothetical protein PR202_gb06906 [Eleusine coracana subsp. coracana]|uniref:F-box domain-containing protein n=1 Tax=Eleusine coracana subsp. coracana TaxID=191504 RepID=A0AAV5EAM7_ELECO|nr:hypothetical protein PR202_gb06906 [Eleusine coracana subsp. coracana]
MPRGDIKISPRSKSNKLIVPPGSLANRLLNSLVKTKREMKPWKGQLPSPRISPLRTFDDELQKANIWRSAGHNCVLWHNLIKTPSFLILRSYPQGHNPNRSIPPCSVAAIEAKLERSLSSSPPPACAASTEAKRERNRPNSPEVREPKESNPDAAETTGAVSTVLGNGDLLREILLLLEFPTCLVRAAAVCRHWLRHASDPAFLRRFRDLHPPRLLGFYLTTGSYRRLEFVPLLPQPPELAAVLRRGCFSLDSFQSSSSSLDTEDEGSSSCRFMNGMDCRNGRLFFGLCCGGPCTYGVHSPLRRGSHPGAIAPFGDEGEATAYFHTLQDDAWHMSASAKMKIPEWLQSKQYLRSFISVDDKIFVIATVKYIIVFNSTSSSFSTINFPDGMVFHGSAEVLLAQGNGSGLYLVHSKGLKLSIWLCSDVNDSVGNWLLLDSFYLRDMFADLRTLDCEAQDENITVVYITAVGRNAEFVFLKTYTCVFYLDVRRKALHKAEHKPGASFTGNTSQHEPARTFC